MFVKTIICIFVIYICFENIYSITLVPERVTLTYVNEKYITNATFNVRRSSKRGTYVLNICGITTVQYGNNVTLHVLVFEHSSKFNQYTRSLIEFHYKLCDMIHKDKIFGAVLRNLGVTQCPIEAGPISWMNVTLPTDFNFQIPFERAKAELKLKNEAVNEVLATAEVFIYIQRRKRKE